ncbi:MAG: tRNA pseudouridine(55) synthase TruB [Nitrospirae bacterium]|nr:MAG: tRNA pseudouridine(55) synthase TruB [Nitrospirota bacterium]
MKLDLTDRRAGVALDGVLVINKPAGWTSHDVVARARTLFGMSKVGHTGTLDPAATGVLVLCLGRATRIAEYLMSADKAYRAVLRLGVATDTQDATGTVVGRVAETLPEQVAIAEVMNRFVGRRQQVPPMYSAVKVKGVPLYKAARAGRTVSRSPREFTVRSLEILSIGPMPEGTAHLPTLDVTFDVVCSKGTYVRTLCADIGELLGVGGHLASLERRRVGRFCIEEALSLDELAGLADRGAVETRLYTLAAALADLPALHVDRDAVEGLCHGVAVPVSRVVSSEGAWMAGAFVRLLSPDGRLVGIGKAPCSAEELKQAHPGTMIKLEKVLA